MDQARTYDIRANAACAEVDGNRLGKHDDASTSDNRDLLHTSFLYR